MLKKALAFLVLFLACMALRAPGTVWNARVQALSNGRMALLDAEGSMWRGRARLAVRDPQDGSHIPLTPVSWQWRPVELLRARIGWSFSVAGLPAFMLAASPLGLSADNLAVQLPVRQVLEQVPNTVAQAGWRGDFSLDVQHWQCNWRGICDGQADLFWRGAASDLFPGRIFGDYHLQARADQGITALQLDTLSGEIRLNAQGRASAHGLQLNGTVEGDPAFVGRLPDVAGRWAQRTPQPGRVLLNVDTTTLAR